jgi:uncharacterized protein YqeY
MNLKEKIENDFQKALLQKDPIEISVLRLLKAALLNKEKEKRYKLFQEEKQTNESISLSDEEVLEVIFSEIKKRKEAILMYEKAKREDLYEKEKKEIEILQKYLPKPFSDQEIENLAKEIIQKVNAKDLKDFGKVMKELMPKVKGRAEGSKVQLIVKKLLSQS